MIDLDNFNELTAEDNKKLGRLLASFKNDQLSFRKNKEYKVCNGETEETIILSHTIICRDSKKGLPRYQVLGEQIYYSQLSPGRSYPVLYTKLKSSPFYFIVNKDFSVKIKYSSLLYKSLNYKSPKYLPWSEKFAKNQTLEIEHESKMTESVRNKIHFRNYEHTTKKWAQEHRFTTYFFKPYFDGSDLFEFILSVPLEKSKKFRILKNIFNQLNHLHTERKIVHRDLKPENIIINPKTFEIEIIDFAYAKNITCNEKDKSCSGSPYYISPEQYELTSTTKSDCYAMGGIVAIVLFANNAGQILNMPRGRSAKYCFHARNLKLLYERLRDDFYFDGYDKVAAFIEKLSARNPTERPTAAEGFELFKTLEGTYEELESPKTLKC